MGLCGDLQLLWNGGLDVNIYEIEHAKLLVGLQKGIQVDDLHRFLLDQPEVHEFEWNGKTYSSASHPKTQGEKTSEKHKRKSKGKAKARKNKVHTGESAAPKPKAAKKTTPARANDREPKGEL